MDTLHKLDSTLETYLVKKAPAIPDDIQELIVKYGPYFIALTVVLGALGLLTAAGLTALYMPFVGMSRYGMMYTDSNILYLLLSGAMLAVQGMALPGLFKRKKQGWTYMLYGSLIGVVLNVVQFNIGGLIIGSLLGLYILYQVKKRYT